MLDVSDGIASDLDAHLRAQRRAAEVQLADLPLDEGVAEVARDLGLDPLELAAAAGEDYELLFTAPAERQRARSSGPRRAAGSAVTLDRPHPHGSRGSANDAVRLLDEAGRPRRLRGWDHFSRAGAAPGLSWTSLTISAVATRWGSTV